MVLQTAELIFNDTPSRYNKDLTDFLERNMRSIIIRGNIRFKFKIATHRDIKNLQNQGINRLPVMFLLNRSIISVPSIVKALRDRVKKSKTTAAPKSEEEVLNDYFMHTLGDIKLDSDGKHILPVEDEGDNTPDLNALFNKELSRRSGEDKKDNHSTFERRTQRPSPPTKPDRNAIYDDDYENRAPNNYQLHRSDNVKSFDPGDPIAALNTVTKPGQETQDDEMMRTLLERMGGGDGFDI